MCRGFRILAIFAILFSLLASGAPAASACLRGTLDERAVQWSTVIIEARLESIADPIALNHTDATTRPVGVLPRKYQTCTFKVLQSLDGAMTKDQSVRVLRLLAADAPATQCPASLSGAKRGDTFILLLRPADQTDINASKDDISPNIRAQAQVIVHMVNRADVDAAALDDLHDLIGDVRQAESGATDDAIAAQVTALAVAQDATEANEAEGALLRMGTKALPALRAKLDDATIDDAGRTRLRRVSDELRPPPLPTESGE